jgi:MFS transporter, ACDE family, multidrug resistance protein
LCGCLGAFIGVTNTLITQTVMTAAPVDRGVASAACSFLRFSGAALAPWVARVLGERISVHAPFWVSAVTVLVGAGVLAASRRHLTGVDAEEDELHEITDEATVLTISSES